MKIAPPHAGRLQHGRASIVRRIRRARGVSLVTAIFLLVVLAGLGAAMMTVATSQQVSSSMDIQGSRAYQAARAGIEWGLYKQLIVNNNSTACFASPASFRLSNGGTLASFAVTVTCSVDTSVAGLARHRLVAVACNQPGAGNVCPNYSNSLDYVQRRIQVDF